MSVFSSDMCAPDYKTVVSSALHSTFTWHGEFGPAYALY